MAEPDFIAGCHERVRAIYRYWDSKRNGRLMPRRADLDPVDIPKLLPDAWSTWCRTRANTSIA
jgi:hypothetical protein